MQCQGNVVIKLVKGKGNSFNVWKFIIIFIYVKKYVSVCYIIENDD